MTNKTRRNFLIATGATGATLALGNLTPALSADPLKIGLVYVSPIGDAGWTFQHDLGRKAIESEYGGKVKVSYVESVPEGADAERVIREFAAGGHNLIFTTSFGYMNPTLKVAKMFPKVTFCHCSGYKRSGNVSTYLARFYEGRYLAGIAAGHATKSKILGYVAAFPIPEVVRGINAFTRGAQTVNPDVEVRVIWISSWYDPGKEREAAETLVSQGADVLMQHTDSTAVVQTAEDRGVHAIGYHSDMSKYGPKAHLTASTHVWDNYYLGRVKEVLDKGMGTSTDVWGGFKDGMVKMSPFGPGVSDESRKMMEAAQTDIASGKLHPFAGPVVDNEGKVRVPEGSVMQDGDLLGTSFYVKGVSGKLPT